MYKLRREKKVYLFFFLICACIHIEMAFIYTYDVNCIPKYKYIFHVVSISSIQMYR